jgi:hypothetical protein
MAKDLLSGWHKGFLRSMLEWPPTYRVSPKQLACIERALGHINAQLGARRDRAMRPVNEQGSEHDGPDNAA